MTEKKIPEGYKVFNVEITKTVSFSVAALSEEEAMGAVENYGADELLGDSLGFPDIDVSKDESGIDLEDVDNGVGEDGDLLEAGDWLAFFPDFDELATPPATPPDTQTLPLFPEEEDK